MVPTILALASVLLAPLSYASDSGKFSKLLDELAHPTGGAVNDEFMRRMATIITFEDMGFQRCARELIGDGSGMDGDVTVLPAEPKPQPAPPAPVILPALSPERVSRITLDLWGKRQVIELGEDLPFLALHADDVGSVHVVMADGQSLVFQNRTHFFSSKPPAYSKALMAALFKRGLGSVFELLVASSGHTRLTSSDVADMSQSLSDGMHLVTPGARLRATDALDLNLIRSIRFEDNTGISITYELMPLLAQETQNP